jgi:sulfonate transport system permease protein
MMRSHWKIVRALAALIVPAALLAGWFWLYKVKVGHTTVVASPPQVWATLLTERDELWGNSFLSSRRLLSGVGLGTLLGTVSGLTLARVRFLRTLLSPTLQVFSAIPFMLFIPFFLMAFGMDDRFRVAVITATTFFLVNSFAFHAIRQLNPDYFELARIYEKSGWQVTVQVLLPASLPAILGAVRFSLMFGWLAVALAESAAPVVPLGGLGYYIIRAKSLGHYPEMFAGAVVLAVLAFVLDSFVAWMQRRASIWCDTNEAAEEIATES